jgi:excisionase family DNA binding protein
MNYQPYSVTAEPLLNKAEAARRLGFCERTVNSLMARGELPYIKLGPRTVRFKPEDVEAYITRNTVG